MLTIVLLTVIAFWNGVSTKLSRDSVKTSDKTAAFVFVGVFALIQFAFYFFVSKQVMHAASYELGCHILNSNTADC